MMTALGGVDCKTLDVRSRGIIKHHTVLWKFFLQASQAAFLVRTSPYRPVEGRRWWRPWAACPAACLTPAHEPLNSPEYVMEICGYFHNVLCQVFSTGVPSASLVVKVTDSVGRRPLEAAFGGGPCGTQGLLSSQATQITRSYYGNLLKFP